MRAVLELARHLRLLGLSPAAPHGSTPSHRGGAAGGIGGPASSRQFFPAHTVPCPGGSMRRGTVCRSRQCPPDAGYRPVGGDRRR
ncbi:Uncharacterised protein [Amycolatopsis camponoti]|uniref:Uncharacterized protein n=1 Tax=Amycolatopsis camponoti TaxID=2606593 RepID=A0A6I8M0K0_9PSEU|nr:Uncharacterised protein [Amycolatopsis camponoti]